MTHNIETRAENKRQKPIIITTEVKTAEYTLLDRHRNSDVRKECNNIQYIVKLR